MKRLWIKENSSYRRLVLGSPKGKAGRRPVCLTIVLLSGIFFSFGSSADDNTRCKIFGNCPYATRASEKGADLVIEDTSRDAKGNPVKPADINNEDNSSARIGKNVDIDIKQPASKYIKNEKQKKQLEGSEVNIGTVTIETEAGQAEIHTPPQPNVDKCDYSYLIGKRLNEITIPKGARVLHEGDAVTMEYMEGRVNIILNKSDVIVNVTCG